MVEGLGLSSLARGLRAGGPLAGFKRMVAPVGGPACSAVLTLPLQLGNATPLASLLRALAARLPALAAGEAGEDLTALGRALLGAATATATAGHSEQELARPLLKVVSPVVAAVAGCAALRPALGEQVDAAYTAVCTLLAVHYPGEYTAELLAEVEELLVVGLQSPHRWPYTPGTVRCISGWLRPASQYEHATLKVMHSGCPRDSYYIGDEDGPGTS
jgi:hypothetical protein